jgi:hypothetical protein
MSYNVVLARSLQDYSNADKVLRRKRYFDQIKVSYNNYDAQWMCTLVSLMVVLPMVRHDCNEHLILVVEMLFTPIPLVWASMKIIEYELIPSPLV